jgi:hypothetical protein
MAEETRAARPSEQRQARFCLAGGILAGLLAGLLMAAVAMARAAASGRGPWSPAREIAAVFLGHQALVGGAEALVIGSGVHLAVAMFLGAVFSLFLRTKTSLLRAAGAGITYAGVVWLVMTHLILPVVDPIMLHHATEQPWWWFGYHLVFGATLLITPALSRLLVRALSGAQPRVGW